jgi:outer membrane receptor for Fe3+-dicitrate
MRANKNKASRRGAGRTRRATLNAAMRSASNSSIAAVVAGILGTCAGLSMAHAQNASSSAPQSTINAGNIQTSQNLQEVVVTATATHVRLLNASYNVVAADRQLIQEANPTSSADILKLSPGIWPESTGGQTGANIEVAGFPSGGDAPFFTNMIEGMPLYGMPSLSFMDSSSLFRLDDTIKRVEIVQGGPSAIFGPAQMGATANYILRTGSATPRGEVMVTYGNQGLWRTDMFYGFQIAPGWYGSVGGFYRKSDGVRSPQFPADDGGQFTATLKHDLDGGSVVFWTRVLDDKNQFMAPFPLIQNANGSYSGYPGFNPLTGSYGSYAIQNVTLPNPAGGFESANLANGRGCKLFFFGSNYNQTVNGWTLHNDFLIDGGGLDTNALFSGNNPRPLSYFLYGCQVAEPTGFCNGSTAIDANNLGPHGQGLSPSLGVSAVYAGSGNPVPMSQSVISQGWWFIQKSLQSITDEFRVSHSLFKGDMLTAGVYLARYSMNDNWSLGNQMLMTNTQNATPIVLSYVQGGQQYNLSSSQGFWNDNSNYNILEHGDATNIAGYFSDQWRHGPWLVDLGARLENINARQRTCNTTAQMLSGPNNLWDNAVPVCNGTWAYLHYERTRPTFTGGINYDFSSHMSAYIRINNGVHFDDFDNGIRGTTNGNFGPLESIHNYEIGYKYQNSWMFADISAYERIFYGLQSQATNSQGIGIPGDIVSYGAKTHGIDVNGYVEPFKHATIRVVGDWMQGHYNGASSCEPYFTINGAAACAAIDGAPLQRQPDFQVRVTPSYAIPTNWGVVSAWVTYEYVGKRYEDTFGLQPLGTYNELGAGIVADVGSHWEFAVRGTNLTNTIALTEGNSREAGVSLGVNNVLLGRALFGREINLSARYKF